MNKRSTVITSLQVSDTRTPKNFRQLAEKLGIKYEAADVDPERKKFWQNQEDTAVIILNWTTNPAAWGKFVFQMQPDEYETEKLEELTLVRLWWD